MHQAVVTPAPAAHTHAPGRSFSLKTYRVGIIGLGRMGSTICEEVVGYEAFRLPYSIAGNDQHEVSMTQGLGHPVDKNRFIYLTKTAGDYAVRAVAFDPGTPAYLSLQIRIAPVFQFLGVIEYLPDNHPSGLGILPKLCLDDHQSPLRRHIYYVNRPRSGVHLHAKWTDLLVRWIYLL